LASCWKGWAAGKVRSSIQALTRLVPKIALIEENGTTREVPAESLSVGAIILVRPGDRVAADGKIIEGEAPSTNLRRRAGLWSAILADTGAAVLVTATPCGCCAGRVGM